jgi:hypothetical protein
MYFRVSLVARLPTSLAPCFDQRRFIPCAWSLGLALSQLLSRVNLQLLNVVLHRLTQIGNQVVAICNLNGGGSACRPPSAYKLDRSRVITSTSGWFPAMASLALAWGSGCDTTFDI